jgi:hypothetical protein
VARVRIVVAALATASVLSVVGAAWSVSASSMRTPDDGSSQYYSGFYQAGDPLNLSYATIPEGRYWLGYSMTVTADSPNPDAQLVCSFVDPNGQIEYLRDDLKVTDVNGTSQVVERRSTFELPSITIALRCVPTVSGHFSAQFSDIYVTIERSGD